MPKPDFMDDVEPEVHVSCEPVLGFDMRSIFSFSSPVAVCKVGNSAIFEHEVAIDQGDSANHLEDYSISDKCPNSSFPRNAPATKHRWGIFSSNLLIAEVSQCLPVLNFLPLQACNRQLSSTRAFQELLKVPRPDFMAEARRS